MSFELRKWQREALEAIEQWDGQSAVIIRAVMGAGKSVVIAEVCKRYQGRVVVAAPTIRLVEQLSAQLDAPAYYTKSKQAGRVSVVCYDSLLAFAEKWPEPELLIVDECHMTENPQFSEAYEALKPGRKPIGFTATDWRPNPRQRITLFEKRIYNYSAAQAMADGVVVPIRLHLTPPDRSFADLDDLCEEMVEEARSIGPTIVSAFNIADCNQFAARVGAQVIHSGIKDPLRVLERFRNREFDVLCHVNMLREGVDLPFVRCLVMRRPRNRVGIPQEVGRVMRADKGKTEAHVFDPLAIFESMGLDYEACLGGENQAPDEDPFIGWLRDTAGELGCKFGFVHDVKLGILRCNPGEEEERELRDDADSMGWDLAFTLLEPKTAADLDLPGPVALNIAQQLIVQLALAWRMAGELKTMESAKWRNEPATEKQIKGLERMQWTAKRTKGIDAALWSLVLEQAALGQYSRGLTSDVWSVLRIIESKGWSLWPKQQD